MGHLDSTTRRNPAGEAEIPIAPEQAETYAYTAEEIAEMLRMGVDDSVIQSILRHSNVAVTQACYIKTVPADSIAAMRQLQEKWTEKWADTGTCAQDVAKTEDQNSPRIQ